MIELLALALFLGSWLLFYKNKMNNRSNAKLGLTMIGVSVLYFIIAISLSAMYQSQEMAYGAVIYAIGLLGTSVIMLISNYVTERVRKRGPKSYFGKY